MIKIQIITSSSAALLDLDLNQISITPPLQLFSNLSAPNIYTQFQLNPLLGEKLNILDFTPTQN